MHEKKRGELSSERAIGNIEENIPQGLNPSVGTTTAIWCGIRRFSAAARAMMCSTEEELKAKWAEKKKGPTAPPPVLFLFPDSSSCLFPRHHGCKELLAFIDKKEKAVHDFIIVSRLQQGRYRSQL